MPTNMIILKSQEYSCFQIPNVDLIGYAHAQS